VSAGGAVGGTAAGPWSLSVRQARHGHRWPHRWPHRSIGPGEHPVHAGGNKGHRLIIYTQGPLQSRFLCCGWLRDVGTFGGLVWRVFRFMCDHCCSGRDNHATHTACKHSAKHPGRAKLSCELPTADLAKNDDVTPRIRIGSTVPGMYQVVCTTDNTTNNPNYNLMSAA